MSGEFPGQSVEDALTLLLENVLDHRIKGSPLWFKKCLILVNSVFSITAVVQTKAVSVNGFHSSLKAKASFQASVVRYHLSPDVVADERKSLGQQFTTGAVKEFPGSDVEAETDERIPVLEVEHPNLDLIKRHNRQPGGTVRTCG